MRQSIIIPTLLLLGRNVQAGCYFPDGTIDKNVEYQPCSKDSSNPLSTICCATNRKDGADICAPNGLCQVGRKKGSPPADAAWTKPSCTNQDWSKDGCLHVCGTDKYPFLTPCNRAAGNGSQRWCCGMTQDCCNEDSGLSIEYLPITFDPKNFTDSSASSSSSSSSSISSSTQTSSATNAPSTTGKTPSSSEASASPSSPSIASPPASAPASASSNSTSGSEPPAGLSTGAKAGIGIGVSTAALALVGLGILFGRRRKPSPYDGAAVEVPAEKSSESIVYAHWDNSQRHGGPSYEGSVMPPPTPRKDEEVQIHEMPVNNDRKELDGGYVGVKGDSK